MATAIGSALSGVNIRTGQRIVTSKS